MSRRISGTARGIRIRDIQGERLRPLQWAAVGISGVAVLVLAVETGSFPWISLALTGSFGLYGLVKKGVGGTVDAVSGLTLETAWLAPVAAVQLAVVGSVAGLAFGTAGLVPTLVLASAGIGTAVPLLLFAASTRRLPLTMVGFVQYLTPILQFLLGVLLLHEPMPTGRLVGFASSGSRSRSSSPSPRRPRDARSGGPAGPGCGPRRSRTGNDRRQQASVGNIPGTPAA